MRMSVEELEPYVERLDREALKRLVLKLAARIHQVEGEARETGPQDPF